MAVIDIQQFVGIAPRVPPRDMGAVCAQVCGNLLATAVEFRPVQGDTTVLSAPAYAGARTLYRLARNAQGGYRSSDDAGWIVAPDLRSYAKGDLHDDATERTYVTFDDGTQRPRVIDAQGADRLLGVPAPAKATVSVSTGSAFTMDDALMWVSGTLIPAIADACRASLVEAHVVGGAPAAGADAMYCVTWYPPDGRYGVASVPMDRAAVLRDPSLGGMASGGVFTVPIECFPKWGLLDRAGLVARLQTIEVPLASGAAGPGGTGSFTVDQAGALADALVPLFDPDGPSIANWRQQMTACVRNFCDAVSTAAGLSVAAAPLTPPAKPATSQFYVYSDVWSGAEHTWSSYRAAVLRAYPVSSNPDMTEYLRAGDAINSYSYAETGVSAILCYEWWLYNRRLDAYNSGAPVAAQQSSQAASDAASLVTRIKQDQAGASGLHDAIHGEYQRRLANLNDLVTGVINGQNILGDGGLIKVDGDRIVDTRFYVATYVNDWGWESAPSLISEMLEVSQYDTVTVQIPAPPAGRQVQKWRLYRSNVGTQDAAYQFVLEGLVADGMTFTDAVKGEALGEVCPTFGWLEPPYRMDNASAQTVKPPKGNDPHLRGLVAMPNGILAGYIDNYVAFCDPYHPYAWPIEYQITTETPVVGLGVFGQSLFVGTAGHPYVVSGADSASMSAVKLPQLQPCVSARSIAGVGDGVVYASNDGLVLVSAAGAQVITAALYAREDWQALQPESIRAVEYEGTYYFWASDGVCRALDFNAKKLVTVELPGVTALRRDELTDALFAVAGERVVRCFSSGRRAGVWRSGLQTFQKPAALAWAVVFGDQSSAQPAVLRWWGDGKLMYEKTVTALTPFRLPPGRPLEHEVELVSAARVTRIQLASSTAELQGA